MSKGEQYMALKESSSYLDESGLATAEMIPETWKRFVHGAPKTSSDVKRCFLDPVVANWRR
jgi:hypothetical protein